MLPRRTIEMLDRRDAERLTLGNHWFRIWMPYQFVHLRSRRFKHLYLPVNRNYKPLGHIGREWVDYREYASQAVIFRSDPHHLEGVWANPERLYLYNDSVGSRLDYFARYERLMSRSMAVVAAKDDLMIVPDGLEQ